MQWYDWIQKVYCKFIFEKSPFLPQWQKNQHLMPKSIWNYYLEISSKIANFSKWLTMYCTMHAIIILTGHRHIEQLSKNGKIVTNLILQKVLPKMCFSVSSQDVRILFMQIQFIWAVKEPCKVRPLSPYKVNF